MSDFGVFAWIMLTLLLLSAVWELILNHLNARRIEDPEICRESERLGIYYNFEKATKYSLAKGHLDSVSAFAEAFFWIALICSGVVPLYMNFLSGRELSGNEQAACFLISVFAARMIFKLPLSIYSTFFLERKYGFSTITVKIFVRDRIKSLIFIIAIGYILSYGISSAYQKNGSLSWGGIIFVILLFLIIPVFTPLLLRIYNKLEPLNDPELEADAQRIMKSAGLKLKALKKMNASLRTNHVNAFFFGTGPSKQIVLFDTLLDMMPRREITAIIGHEAAHCIKHHTRKLHFIQIVSIVLVIVLSSYLSRDFWILQQFGVPMDENLSPSHFAYGILLFIIFLESTIWLILPFFMILSQKFEYEADALGAKLCGDPSALSSALRRLGRGNLAVMSPHPLYQLFKCRHPSLLDRIRRLEEITPPNQETESVSSETQEEGQGIPDSAP